MPLIDRQFEAESTEEVTQTNEEEEDFMFVDEELDYESLGIPDKI
jgi:hypothetical protein